MTGFAHPSQLSAPGLRLLLLACTCLGLSLFQCPGVKAACFIPPSCDFNVKCNMTVDEDKCFCGWKSTGWTIVNVTRPDNSSYDIASLDPEEIPHAVLYSVIQCPGLPPPHCLKVRFKLELDTEIVVMLHQDKGKMNCTIYKALTSRASYNSFRTALVEIPYKADWISIEATRLKRPYKAHVSLTEVDYITASCETIPVPVPDVLEPGVNLTVKCFQEPPRESHAFEVMVIGFVIVAVMIGVCIAYAFYSRKERSSRGKSGRGRRSEGRGGRSSRQARDNQSYYDDEVYFHQNAGAYDTSFSSLENPPRNGHPPDEYNGDEEVWETRRPTPRGGAATARTHLAQNTRASPRDYGAARRRESPSPGQGRASAFRSPSDTQDERRKPSRERERRSSSKKRAPPRPVVKEAFQNDPYQDYQHVDFSRMGKKGESPRNIFKRFGEKLGMSQPSGKERDEERVNIVEHEQ